MGLVLLVDASPLIYATFNAMGHFATKAGEPTGLRFGFLRSIRMYADRVKPDKVVIVFDSPGAVKKAEGVSDYKANRTMTPLKVKMYEQVPALRQLLAMTKYTQVDAEGYEADDIIGSLARKLSGQGHSVYVVSPDNDMAQLAAIPGVRVWMPPKGKEKGWFKDHDWVVNEFQVQPNALLMWRAIEGDTSDNIAGLTMARGCKDEVKATLREMVAKTMDVITPEMFWNTWDLKHRSFVFSREYREKVQNNFKLMALVDPDHLFISKGLGSSADLMAELERLEMKSLLKHIPEFVA